MEKEWEMGKLFLAAAEAGDDVDVFERGGVAFDLRAGGDLLERRRMILPERVLGSAAAKRTSSGVATGPMTLRTCFLVVRQFAAGLMPS
jgi:hypothetical protein